MWRGLSLAQTYSHTIAHTHTSIIKNKSSYCLLLSLSLSLYWSQRLRSILSLILKHQNYVGVLLLQLMPSPLTTGSDRRKISYSQILKLLLFVFVIKGLLKGFFLLKNRRIVGQDDRLLTTLVTIRKLEIQGRPRSKSDSALIRILK